MTTIDNTLNVWFTNEQSSVTVGEVSYTLNHPRYHVRHNGKYHQFNNFIEAKNMIDTIMASVNLSTIETFRKVA